MKRYLPFLAMLLFWCAGCSRSLLVQGSNTGSNFVADALAQQQGIMEANSNTLNSLVQAQNELSKELNIAREQLGQIQSQVEFLQAKHQESAQGQQGSNHSTQSKVVESIIPVPVVLDKILLGRIEWVWLDLLGKTLKAKMDTGAKSSSLSASNIQEFERDGKKWVRFSIPEGSTEKFYEAPLIKYQNVRQASMAEMDVRAKIMLKLRIGGLVEETEFTLTDRSNMIYPLLLGRRFLRDIAVVDVAQKFVQEKFENTLDLADKRNAARLK